MEIEIKKLEPDRPASPALSTGRTILVIEDDAIFLHALRLVLSRLGHRVFTARNVSEAEETWAMARAAIDMIVCDHCLGYDRGADLVQLFKTHQPEVKIVLCSGGIAPAGIPGVRFLAKPFHISDLFEAAA